MRQVSMSRTQKIFGCRQGFEMWRPASAHLLTVVLLLMTVLLSTASVRAEIKPASLFTDHMVLQRGMPVPVWGRADPQERVTVEFAGQEQSTIADANGKWMVHLDALAASAVGQELRISGSSGVVVLNDVLVGEVWICSGQSNMAMPLGGVPEIKALASKARNVRGFQVENTVAFAEREACAGVWREGLPNSAVAGGFAFFLEDAAKVPVGIILTSWGSSSIEGWMPRDMIEELPHFKAIMDAFDANQQLKGEIDAILAKGKDRETREDVKLRTQPNIIYNAMMKPLVPYACRGIVWYQGEANAQNIEDMLQYGTTLPQWIQRYRQLWKRDDFHFLGVMLPGYGKLFRTPVELEDPSIRSWACMRESQLKALALPHTGIATTIDLGLKDNVHPKDKLPLVRRLALLAERDTLGMEIMADGPMMTRVELKGDSVAIHYANAQGLKTKDGEAPTAFWLADDSAKWVRAAAVIDGEMVVLRSPELARPLYVRYAFAAMPKVNLINVADLPARPFRTDTFAP